MRELIGIDVGTRSVKGLIGIVDDKLQILLAFYFLTHHVV